MFYIYINEDRTCTVYTVKEYIPESLKDAIVEYTTIPEGEGILKAHEDGTLYLEPIPVDPIDPPDPVPPEPTVEQRLERIELTSAQTQVQGDYVAFLVETLLAK